jgi:hypothetical protein
LRGLGDGNQGRPTGDPFHGVVEATSDEPAGPAASGSTTKGSPGGSVVDLAAGLSAPIISSARVTNTRFRVAGQRTAVSAKAPRGTSFRFNLSAMAKLQVAITRSTRGVRHGASCVASTVRLRREHAKSCTRTVLVATLTRLTEPKGEDRLDFSGRIGSHPLMPHSYVAVLTATNAGGRSRAVALPVTVMR